MEDSKKRVREDDSETHLVSSPEPKIRRVDSSESQHDTEVQLQDYIFNMLEDAYNVPERDMVQGLDSVIKSFEDEINVPSSDPVLGDPAQIPGSGELQCNNLGYLLEASDDELGLPPTEPAGEQPGRSNQEMAELASFMGFEDDMPSYDAFGFGSGFAADGDGDGDAGAFAVVDGLFDYAEPTGDVFWRSESLQAM